MLQLLEEWNIKIMSNKSKKSRLSGKQKIWQKSHKDKLKQYNLQKT